MNTSLKLECVTTCVNYGDFLAETLPLNKAQFNRLVIVTTPQDTETQRICEYHNVMCVQTEAFGTEAFNKAAGINAGLQHLDQDGWVVHLDADTTLPVQFREVLERFWVDPSKIYGVDRYIINGHKAWRKHCRTPLVQQQLATCLVHTDAYQLGARLNVPKLSGWMPLGFFQLWNPNYSGVRTYPEMHEGADRTDVLFATQWPRGRREFIPEIIAYHLQSEDTPQGVNWDGRTTLRFEDTRRWPRWWRHWHHWWHRHHHRHPHYC